MSSQRIVGTVLIVIGVALLIIGLNASNSVADRWSNFFTGHFTDATVWYIVVGVASTLGGLMLMPFGGRESHA